MKKKPAKMSHGAQKRQRLVPLSKEEASKPLSDRPSIIGDLRNLQEMLGINLKDLGWITAFTARDIPVSPAYSAMRLDSVGKRVQLSLLIRFLSQCLEGCPLLPDPPMEDVLPVIFRVITLEDPTLVEDDQVSWGRISMCLGTTDWSGHNWSMGGARSPLVQRIFLSLFRASSILGVETTAQIYWRILNEEARARGFSGLSEVLRRKSWHRPDLGAGTAPPPPVIAPKGRKKGKARR